MAWCKENPGELWNYHVTGFRFIAIADGGVVVKAETEDEFLGLLSDLRPSIVAQLYQTHTSLWCVGELPVTK